MKVNLGSSGATLGANLVEIFEKYVLPWCYILVRSVTSKNEHRTPVIARSSSDTSQLSLAVLTVLTVLQSRRTTAYRLSIDSYSS